MNIRMLILIGLVMSALQPVCAQDLHSRNIPDARLLYEDASGRYFGAIMSSRDQHPENSSADEVLLKVYIERTVNDDGTFFNATSAQAKPYEGAPLQEGIHYGEDEIARMSDHVIPAIGRVFPEWSSHRNWDFYNHWILVGVYIDGLYLEPHGGGSAESYEAEEPVLKLSFKRSLDGRGWRPAYEGDNLLGDPASITQTKVANIREQRGEIASEKTASRRENLAMFERQDQQAINRKAQRLDAYFKYLQDKRRIGIVYKSESYWSQFTNFETPRNVIEGNFNFIVHPGDFAEAYLTFIDQYYAVCESFLPSQRTSYTETWFETRYGTTSKTDSFYVEMDPRYGPNYERMADIRYRRDESAFLKSVVNSLAGLGGSGRSPFAFVGETLTMIAKDIVSDQETLRFLKKEGCSSPIVSQYDES